MRVWRELTGICDGISDDTLEEGLENTSGLLIDHGGDTLDTTTAGQSSDSGLGDTLDVVSQDLAVSLRTTLAKALASFALSILSALMLMKKNEEGTYASSHVD